MQRKCSNDAPIEKSERGNVGEISFGIGLTQRMKLNPAWGWSNQRPRFCIEINARSTQMRIELALIAARSGICKYLFAGNAMERQGETTDAGCNGEARTATPSIARLKLMASALASPGAFCLPHMRHTYTRVSVCVQIRVAARAYASVQRRQGGRRQGDVIRLPKMTSSSMPPRITWTFVSIEISDEVGLPIRTREIYFNDAAWPISWFRIQIFSMWQMSQLCKRLSRRPLSLLNNLIFSWLKYWISFSISFSD